MESLDAINTRKTNPKKFKFDLKSKSMKKKTIIYTLVSLIIVALAIFTLLDESDGTIYNDFLISDTASVEQIFMVNKENQQVTLNKRNDIWYVNDKEAAIGENVRILLKTMMYIDIRKPVSKASYNTVVKQLATNSVKVEIYQRSPLFTFLGIKAFVKLRKTKEFYVGSPTRDLKGTIMKMADSDDIYITYLAGLNGYLTERFSANYSDWLNHSIWKLPIKSIVKVKVEFGKTPMESYEIQNIGNRKFDIISLYSNSRVMSYDTIRVLEQMSAFRSINFETLLDDMPAKRLDSLRNSIPLRTVTVTTIDQNIISIKMYQRPNYTNKPDLDGTLFDYDMDRMYAIIDGFEYPVTVQYFVVDNISRPLSFLSGELGRKSENFEGFKLGK